MPIDKSALEIESGQELDKFDLGTVPGFPRYSVLTGFEGNDNHLCWWCGSQIEGKRSKHYCNGHWPLYMRHFDWQYASKWALKRADGHCQNCFASGYYIKTLDGYGNSRYSLEVHHIVPLKGGERQFTAYNLPWNLIVLCHDCHWELHRIMNHKTPMTIWDLAIENKQYVMVELLN